MQKTTVYIPVDLKRLLGRIAAARGVSEAELVREALRALVETATPPKPRVGLFKSGKLRLAEQADCCRRLKIDPLVRVLPTQN